MTTTRITHFSDLLCVWAYISQARIDELKSEFGNRIELRCRFFSVFGDTREKFEKQWQERGGVAAYSRHVIEVAQQFGHVSIHPRVWLDTTPRSSLPAHLHLNAVQIMEHSGEAPAGAAERLAWRLRQAFFADSQDIGDGETIRHLGQALDIDGERVRACIASGAAYAAMAQDMQQARELDVRASPTLIFNEDRQRLTGNVGYRIIEANVRELLTQPSSNHQSWC